MRVVAFQVDLKPFSLILNWHKIFKCVFMGHRRCHIPIWCNKQTTIQYNMFTVQGKGKESKMIIWCHVICWRTIFTTILLSCLCNRQWCLLAVNIDFFLPGHCFIYELNQTTNQPAMKQTLFLNTPNYVMDAAFVIFSIAQRLVLMRMVLLLLLLLSPMLLSTLFWLFDSRERT